MVQSCRDIEGRNGFQVAQQLSTQRSTQNLTCKLLALLNELPLVREAEVFEVVQHNFKRVPVSSHTDELVIRRFDEPKARKGEWAGKEIVEQAFESKQSACVELDEDNFCFAYPIQSENGPFRIILTWLPRHDKECLSFIENIATLYKNIIIILDSMERDALTGLFNRQSFNRLIEHFISFSRSHSDNPFEQIWVAVLDIDHFKSINDTYGHLYGDEVLLLLAQLMSATFRYTDFLFRYGGEEFVVVMSYTDEVGARVGVERFRQVIEEYAFPGERHVTVSIGYSQITPDKLATAFIDEADKALYFAKDHGRNRVVAYAEIAEAEEKLEEPASEVTFF